MRLYNSGMNLKKLYFLLLIMLCSQTIFAQVAESVEMADKMRESGKIYVVVAVLVIIFIGISAYLFSIDRKLSRLEKQLKENK